MRVQQEPPREVSINIYKSPQIGEQGKKQGKFVHNKARRRTRVESEESGTRGAKLDKIRIKKVSFESKKKAQKATEKKCWTLRNFPVILNKSCLSFVSEKQNSYYRKLKQEKFPRQLRKILPQGINDSFFTSKDQLRNASLVKPGFRSAVQRKSPVFFPKSKPNQSGDRRGLINDLESHVSDIKAPHLTKTHSKHPLQTISNTFQEPNISEMVSLTRFYYKKKRPEQGSESVSRAKRQATPSETSLMRKKREADSSQKARERLKSIVWQMRTVGDDNSNLAVDSFENVFKRMSESSQDAVEESSEVRPPTVVSKQMVNGNGYLDLGSKKSSNKLIGSSKNSISDWRFQESSIGEKNISSSEMSLDFSEKSVEKDTRREEARPEKKRAELNSIRIKSKSELTETKPETSDSKCLLDLSRAGETLLLTGGTQKDCLGGETQAAVQTGTDGAEEMAKKFNFLKSEKVEVLTESKQLQRERSLTVLLNNQTGLTENDFAKKKQKSGQTQDMELFSKERRRSNVQAKGSYRDIRLETNQMLECLQQKEEEMLPRSDSNLLNSSMGEVNKDILHQIIDNILGEEIWRTAINRAALPSGTRAESQPGRPGPNQGVQIEVNEIESLNDISLNSEEMSNKKIDLNQFRNNLERSESVAVLDQTEDLVDIKKFLQNTAQAIETGQAGDKGHGPKTKQILKEIDILINQFRGQYSHPVRARLAQLGLLEQAPIGDGILLQREPNLNFLRNNGHNMEDSHESIYGIRTNINAVVEYCQLLINFLVENYSEYLVQKVTGMRLQRETKDLLGFEISPFRCATGSSLARNIGDLSDKQLREKVAEFPNASFNWEKYLLEKPRTPNNSPEHPEKGPEKSLQRDIQVVNLFDAEKEKFCWAWKTKNDMILTEQIYLALEHQILSIYENKNINASLFNMQKIYHRCIFDCFNEIMTSFVRQDRLFKLNQQDCRIMKLTVFSQQEFEYILAKTQNILIEYVQQQCGMLKDKEDSLLDSILRTYDFVKYANAPINPSLVNIRKECMNRSCYEELRETPNDNLQWLRVKQDYVNYLADLVTEALFEDTLGFLGASPQN